METAHEQVEYFELTVADLTSLLVAGLVAGIAMGIVVHQVTETIRLVGALYGTEATAFGWLFHPWNAVVFAVIFGGFFVWRRLSPFRDRVLASTSLGIL